MCVCACVCVPTVCGGRSVPSACRGARSPVCWRSKLTRWLQRLLRMFPPLCLWCGCYSGYCKGNDRKRCIMGNLHNKNIKYFASLFIIIFVMINMINIVQFILFFILIIIKIIIIIIIRSANHCWSLNSKKYWAKKTKCCNVWKSQYVNQPVMKIFLCFD